VPTSKDSCRSRYLTCARENRFDCSISRHCASRPNRHHVRTLEYIQPILVFQVLKLQFTQLKENKYTVSLIDWTGERFIPGYGGTQIRYEHMHRYAIAYELCKGKRTLDYGCGEGYGTAILAKNASSVVGVDVDPEAIEHSKDLYADFSNASFHFLESSLLPFPDGHFEFITCFEVIEHVTNQEEILSELSRVLSPTGTLLISTPNKAEYSDLNNFKNEYHVKEFYIDEFRTFLNNRFEQVSFLGQRLVATSLVFNIDEDDRQIEITHEVRLADKPETSSKTVFEPVYVIAVCGHTTSGSIKGSTFITPDDALSKEQLSAVPLEQVNSILESMQEERKVARQQLDYYESELEAQRIHIYKLDQQVSASTEKLKKI
jgi:2-polyprenyl-3-methyl-5-hydroxy-6-metoxy-1,4-benzoquinol methylase